MFSKVVFDPISRAKPKEVQALRPQISGPINQFCKQAGIAELGENEGLRSVADRAEARLRETLDSRLPQQALDLLRAFSKLSMALYCEIVAQEIGPVGAKLKNSPVKCGQKVYQIFEVEGVYRTYEVGAMSVPVGPDRAVQCTDVVVAAGRAFQSFKLGRNWSTYDLTTGEVIAGDVRKNESIQIIVRGGRAYQDVLSGEKGLMIDLMHGRCVGPVGGELSMQVSECCGEAFRTFRLGNRCQTFNLTRGVQVGPDNARDFHNPIIRDNKAYQSFLSDTGWVIYELTENRKIELPANSSAYWGIVKSGQKQFISYLLDDICTTIELVENKIVSPRNATSCSEPTVCGDRVLQSFKINRDNWVTYDLNSGEIVLGPIEAKGCLPPVWCAGKIYQDFFKGRELFTYCLTDKKLLLTSCSDVSELTEFVEIRGRAVRSFNIHLKWETYDLTTMEKVGPGGALYCKSPTEFAGKVFQEFRLSEYAGWTIYNLTENRQIGPGSLKPTDAPFEFEGVPCECFEIDGKDCYFRLDTWTELLPGATSVMFGDGIVTFGFNGKNYLASARDVLDLAS